MTLSKGINNTNLKYGNRGLVLKMIATNEARTRIDIAKKTGLSKMSVTNIINEFIKHHIVKETEIERNDGAGRNPVVLTVAEKCKKVIGLYIFRDVVCAMKTDITNKVLEKVEYELNAENAANIYDIIYKAIDEVTKDCSPKDILGIGVGSLGPVDVNNVVIVNPTNFYGLENIEIGRKLEEKYGVPVFLDNIYDCAAMVEKYYGVGKHYSDFIFMGLKNGVGSGIVMNDSIFHSSSGATPELGHISIDYNGKPCSCGNRGCLELYADSEKLRIKLMFATGKDLSFKEFCEIADKYCSAHEGDQANEKPVPEEFSKEQLDDIDMLFTDMAKAIASAVTSVVNLLHSEAFIIGSDGYYLPSKYIRFIEDTINESKIRDKSGNVTVLKSGFGDEAHVVGCATPVLDAAFKGLIEV